MKYPILLAMSLLSLLFGCFTKKTPPKTAGEYPRFPATDNPAAQVALIKLDGGYWPKCFFIAEDQQHVYVLGYGKIVSTTMQDGEETRPDLRDQGNYRLYELDTQGAITQRLHLPVENVHVSARFGRVGDHLLLWFNEWFLVLNTQKLAVTEKIPIYSQDDFPSKTEVELMTPYEREDAYRLQFDAALQKSSAAQWLDWSIGGSSFVFVQGKNGRHTAWLPTDQEEATISDLKSRFAAVVVSSNPQAKNYRDGDNFEAADGPVRIREAAYISAGTQLDYPNYKSRMVLNYEMVVGANTLHFSTTDKSRHNLRLDFSDKLLLATADGAGWVKYEGELYRIR